jgi:hypothetical protein
MKNYHCHRVSTDLQLINIIIIIIIIKADSHIPCRHGNGMVCVNQTRPQCVNQMGKTQYKQRDGMAGERHGMCESNTAALRNSNGKDIIYTLGRTAWQGNVMRTAWERHGMCESNTAALCNSNGKDIIYTLGRTAWQGNGMVCVNRPLQVHKSRILPQSVANDSQHKYRLLPKQHPLMRSSQRGTNRSVAHIDTVRQRCTLAQTSTV